MPHVTFVTLGARDLGSLRDFCRRWGWPEREGASESFAAYDAGGVRLALYPIELLAEEAAPGEEVPGAGWNGITLAMNLTDHTDVDAEFDRAVAAGATQIARLLVEGGVCCGSWRWPSPRSGSAATSRR